MHDEIVGQEAFVYYNSIMDLWSVKIRGKVVAHCERIALRDCRYKVLESGRQRVLRDRQKNVHAGVKGRVVSVDALRPENLCGRRVRYNPYETETFMCDGSPIHEDESVWMEDGKVWSVSHGIEP